MILLYLLLIILCSGCTRDITTNPESEGEEDITSRFWEEYYSPFISDICSVDADDKGNLFVAGSIYQTGRVFGSDSRGESWRNCGIPASADPEQVRIDRSGNLWVVSEPNVAEDRCLYYLLSEGADWHKIEIEVYSLQFDSQNRCFYNTREGLYVTPDLFNTRNKVLDEKYIELFEVSPNDEILVLADSTMFRSRDSGETWSEFEVPAGERIYPGGLETDSEGHIYILVRDYYNDETALYRSSDGGRNWSKVLASSGGSMTKLLVTSGNTVLCYLNRRLMRSLDRGESWVELSTGYFYGSIYSGFEECFDWGDITLAAVDEETIFVADDRGIYRSVDNGDSWDLVGLPRHGYSDFLIDSENRMWFGCYDGGVYIKDPSSAGLRHVNIGLIYPEILFLVDNGMGDILAGTVNGIFRTSTENPEWVRAGLDSMKVRGLYSFDDGSVAAFVTAADYGWKDGIYKSGDGGNSWIYLGMCGYHIKCAEADNEGKVYAGTLFGGVFRYTGEGKVWEQLNRGLSSNRVYELEADQAGCMYAISREVIYRFNEADTSWTESLRTGTTATELMSDDLGNLYAVTENHIYRKGMGSDDWEAVNKKPYNIRLGSCEMEIDRDGYIYFALNIQIYRTAELY